MKFSFRSAFNLITGSFLLIFLPLIVEAQDLSRYQWLVGNWEGEAFGGKVYENWSPSSGDEMLGTFQLVTQGENSILEFMAIRSNSDTTIFYFNHFDPDLNRWEDKPIILGLENINDHEFKFRNFTEGKTAPRSLTYHFDKEKDHLIVIVEEWEKTSAGFESFSITYHRN